MIKKLLFLFLLLISLFFLPGKLPKAEAIGNAAWLQQQQLQQQIRQRLIQQGAQQCDETCQVAASTAASQNGCEGLTGGAAQFCALAASEGPVQVAIAPDGSVTIVCSNGAVMHFPPGLVTSPTTTPPTIVPPTQPPPPVSCGQPCSDDNFCVTQNNAGGGGCTKCVGAQPIPTPDTNGQCPTGFTAVGAGGVSAGGGLKGGPGAADGAGANVVCQGGQGTCQAPPVNTPTPLPTSTPVPSPTPTTPPAACGTACSNDFGCQTAKDGCTACIANKCAVPPTPTPTITPTPVFQPSCTCDGIQNTDIFTGQQITITANAKVPANLASRQQVLDQSFALYKGADTLVTRLAHAEAVPAVQISQAADFVRYQSIWKFTMPALEAGQTYRIGAQLNCQPKTTGFNFTPNTNRAVLGAQDDNPSFVQKLLNIIAALLGRAPEQNIAVNIPPTPTPVTVSNTAQSANVTPVQNSLQLGVIQPGEVYEKTCDYIKFRYNGF